MGFIFVKSKTRFQYIRDLTAERAKG